MNKKIYFPKLHIVRKLIVLCAIISFFLPADVVELIIDNISWLEDFQKYFRYIVIVVVLIYYFYNMKISKIVLICGIYCIFNIAITILFRGDVNAWGLKMITSLICVMLFEIIVLKEKIGLLKDISISCNLLIIANFLSIVFYPDGISYSGLGRDFLLGFENGFGIFMIPVSCINLILLSYGYKSILAIIGTLLSFISIILVWSATSVFGFFIILVGLIYVFMLHKTVHIYHYAITSIMLFLLIIIMRAQYLFEPIIVGVLQRDLTFTGRTFLWDIALSRISNSLLWGYGQNSDLQRTVFKGVSATHNHILDILNQSGIIGLLLFMFLIFIVIYQMHKFRKCMPVNMITICLGSMLIIMEFESYDAYIFYPLFFAMLTLGFYSKKLSSICEMNRRNASRGRIYIKF
ncbi:MAG: O-antigen ligase family protein [Bacilli bacterium]|nr:O-antigen ligase family protein [Bacilli bacterium]